MQHNKELHIVSFNIPHPPNYGGIIDIFYKIKALHQLGISIYLHCFEYDRPQQKELDTYCKKVYYYQRSSVLKSLFSRVPFIIKNRENNALIARLKQAKAPILFEGLHTTFPLTTTVFKAKTFVRTHNIEHDYFKGLAKSESNVFKKCFYLLESRKLKNYERILHKVDGIFAIAPYEHTYFSNKYGKSSYIPAFHNAIHSSNENSKGGFVLYHGDLRVADNIKAASFLIEVYKNTPYTLRIASSTKAPICKAIDRYENIEFKSIATQEDLALLFEQAHINTLITFQKTGIKLKLLHALYKGKFVIANTKMIADTGLENGCELANTKEEILAKTELLFAQKFTSSHRLERKELLKALDPRIAAKQLKEILFRA